ncbi:MAG: hypothetical protein QUU85_00595 [Candidatus Eisenbacteria bacterium]|nr:hypothetical protein [Candidatus Eisenbacteria bacterium]
MKRGRARRWSAAVLFAAGVLGLGFAQQARAVGDNSGAVLYLSLAPEIPYDPAGKYTGLSATPSPEQAIVTISPSSQPRVVYILAAFPDSAKPELAGACFGIRYSEGVKVLRTGRCRECLELPTSDWPASDEGILLGFTTHPDTSRVVELGWLAVQAAKEGTLELIPHPDPRFGGKISTAEPVETSLAGFGAIGFGRPGNAPAPVFPGPEMGATCVQDSLCVMLTRTQAGYYQGAEFLGEGSFCTSRICTIRAPVAACCLPDGSCRMVQQRDCVREGGTWAGDGSSCDRAPCERLSKGDPAGASGD